MSRPGGVRPMRPALMMMIGLTLGCVGLLSAEPAPPAAAAGKLPEGAGLSAKYPRDAGIAGDRRVLFAEDFESGGVEALKQRWDEVSNQAGRVVSFSDDVPAATGGKRSLQMTATLGQNTGGHLYS